EPRVDDPGRRARRHHRPRGGGGRSLDGPLDGISMRPTGSVKPSPDAGMHFDVGQSFRIPDLPGTPLPRRAFVSTYFDTSDYRLARSEVTVHRLSERRKHHWEIELARGRARFELTGRGPSMTPLSTLRNLLTVYARGAELVPIATLATRRSGVVVKDSTE